MNNFQYDSCVSRGICSVSPRSSALTLVIVIFLSITARFSLKLFKDGKLDSNVKYLILNSAILTVMSREITETAFLKAVNDLKKALPDIIEKYKNNYGEECFKNEEISSSEFFKMSENITDAIKLGERIFKNIVLKILPEIRDLHQIMLVLTKSLSINLLDYESYENSYDEAFEAILRLLGSINPETESVSELTDIIKESAIIDNDLMIKIRSVQEERYGKQCIKDVSYSTIPSKAVLVAGSNLRELEYVLETLKNTDIDVYTHDDMMLAHTFPKFWEYKNLKGQYGEGGENCLIDFATFPGAIVLTKHSLHNVENLYRGRLFTTDDNPIKGVIKITDNDFSEVIESANSAKGFKKGKRCETVSIGYDFDNANLDIKNKIQTLNTKRIVLIGLEKYSLEQQSYFEKLIKLSHEDTLIISFSYNSKKENLIHLNTCFDSLSILKIFKEIKKYKLPITVFMPKCDKNTVSQMIYFSTCKNIKVFVGKCTPIILNPSLMNTLEKDFNIKSITTAAEDIKN